jgi:hypothetical protein
VITIPDQIIAKLNLTIAEEGVNHILGHSQSQNNLRPQTYQIRRNVKYGIGQIFKKVEPAKNYDYQSYKIIPPKMLRVPE